MPDAFSKTVPIWCAVINRAIARITPDNSDHWDINLYTPPQVVSSQEHAQIEARLDGWANALIVCFSTISVVSILFSFAGIFLQASSPSLPTSPSLDYSCHIEFPETSSYATDILPRFLCVCVEADFRWDRAKSEWLCVYSRLR